MPETISTRSVDRRSPQPAPVKAPRRKKQPYKPGAHLGLPTAERFAKSHGFDEVNLAAGDGPKVPRASEKMPFTPQAIRNRYTEEEIATAVRLKREPNFERRLTSIDKALEENEFQALDWWVQCHIRREAGRPAAMRYDDAPKGLVEEGGAGDREKRWRIDLQVMSVVDTLLPEAHKVFLEYLSWMACPGHREGAPPTKLELGQSISQMKGRDTATGAFVGYTKAVAQAISSARADAIVIMKRRRDAREMQMRDERKQQAGALFSR